MSNVPRRATVALLALVFAASSAPAAKYGDIEVTVKNEPRGNAFHGYAEVEFLVVNRSEQTAHEVRITYPKATFGYGSDYLRAVSRSVTVEPGKSVRVALTFPELLVPPYSGSGAVVAIDGREQEEALRMASSGSRGYSSRGSSGGGSQVLVLYSKSVDTRFPDWVNMTRSMTGALGNVEAVRADLAPDQWGTNWLGYTRYDGVVLTADDLRLMPAEVRNAIGQYVECGGSLFVMGRDPPLPGPWPVQPAPLHRVFVAAPGFGQCLITDATDLSRAPQGVLQPVFESWRETAAPWQKVREPGEANRAFPVVEDISVPVKGLLALMFVFAIVIGPVNLIVLARKKRKLWLFWTVPTISFVTCLTVIGYMALTEGWQGRSRIEGFTVLDENSRRASSLGWTGFYTPLLPRGGLRFSAETEIAYQNGADPHSYGYGYSSRGRRSAGSALSIDWTREQHLESGWLTPRVPAHFAVRKSELRRERMTISKAADGSVEAVNGLGADLSEFWYRDEAGNVFRAEAIPAGGRATLKPAPPAQVATGPVRRFYVSGNWSSLVENLQKGGGPGLLRPRTYFAVMESAPFLDDGMPKASVRRTRSVVFGILKEGGDGN